MDADAILTLLGRPSHDAAIENIFTELPTRRRPWLDPEAENEFRDWVLIRRRGIELGFIDEAYLLARDGGHRARKKASLVLFQVYFYTQRDDIASFAGNLPFSLRWNDSQDVVRRKLAPYDSRRRSYLKDVWDLPDYRLIVDYKKGGHAIDRVVCELVPAPWPEKGRRQPDLRALDFISLFGMPASSPILHQRLQPLDLLARMEEDEDDHAVDFLLDCGLTLSFTASKNLRLKKRTVLSKSDDMVLGAVRFLGQRELDAREWKGELPFHLSFHDSQQVILNKVGHPCTDRGDDYFQGFVEWQFPDYTLHVMYSNMANLAIRIMLTAPGF